jgi:hypothetical protein
VKGTGERSPFEEDSAISLIILYSRFQKSLFKLRKTRVFTRHATVVMLGLPLFIVTGGWLLWMMYEAGRISTDLMNSADLATLGNDCLSRKSAHFELGPLASSFDFGFILPDCRVYLFRGKTALPSFCTP